MKIEVNKSDNYQYFRHSKLGIQPIDSLYVDGLDNSFRISNVTFPQPDENLIAATIYWYAPLVFSHFDRDRLGIYKVNHNLPIYGRLFHFKNHKAVNETLIFNRLSFKAAGGIII